MRKRDATIAAQVAPTSASRPAGVERREPRQSGPFPTRKLARRYWIILGVLAVLAALILYGLLAWANPMPVGSDGFWRIVSMRATNVIVIVLVAFTQSIATISFQTVTNNRILTPSIMGFESLYRLVQTGSVFFLGAAGLMMVRGTWQYLLQVGLMVLLAGALYGWLLTGRYANMQVMLLIGIILGGGLGALASFMQRLLTPTEFDLLTARLIGSIANADSDYLPISIPLALAAGGALWMMATRLNLLSLGTQTAVNLGSNHKRETILVLLLVSVLMAVSTSLVGPMTFYGFLVAMITYQLADTYDHRYLFPMAWLGGIVILGGAYFLLKNVFYAQGAVGIIIEIVGGVFFLGAILKKGRL